MITENAISLNIKKGAHILKKYGITIPTNFAFSNINIVIGPNGAGKTRFLKSVRDLYEQNSYKNIVYGYFPGLCSSRNTLKKANSLPIYTLYESLQESEIVFEDFLIEIEAHAEEYIPELLKYHSQRQQSSKQKVLNTLQDTLSCLSNKKIEFLYEDDLMVISDNKKCMPLSELLKLFSPGELILFYMAVFISLQEHGSNKKILILDEPECHLHPKALLAFFKTLEKSQQIETIWIATHSLFLIPEVKFENIVYIENSEILKRSSRTYRDIIDNLLGENNTKTTQFLSSISQWQYSEYIAECFSNPEVIDTINPNDEQVQLFVKFLKDRPAINVLDYGGGSARLGRSLKEINKSVAQNIHYSVYDPKPTYDGNEFQVYCDLNKITQKYDCIVLMNVLHEIEPINWVETFKNIYNLLADDGYLLFVETSSLSKGEMPNKTGYLVLDNTELKYLFNCKKNPETITIEKGQKSICIPINKKLIRNVSHDTITKALQQLEKCTLCKLKKERESSTFEYSRYYAYLTQLYINAKIYNDTISSDNSKLDQITIVYPDRIEILIEKILSHNSIVSICHSLIEKLHLITPNSYYKKITEVLCDSLKNCKIKDSDTDFCWSQIDLLEILYGPNNNIALFYICLYILGDKIVSEKMNSYPYYDYCLDIIESLD